MIPTKLLIDCYRRDLGINVAEEFHSHNEIFLYHCPQCQLRFFYPQVTGSASFYQQIKQQPWYYPDDKFEYQVAQRHISAGQRVFDIGCGDGRFSSYIPDNPYQGLETPDADKSKNPAIAYETLTNHAQHSLEHYDVVCAFQVLEHVTDPVAFINTAKACLKPGGLLIMGIPTFDSYLQHLTNFTLNAPPHHISWWQVETLQELGRQCQLNTLGIDKAPLEYWESQLYWMQWLGNKLTGLNPSQRSHFSSQKRWRWLTPLLYVGACVIDSLPNAWKPSMLTGSTQVWLATK